MRSYERQLKAITVRRVPPRATTGSGNVASIHVKKRFIQSDFFSCSDIFAMAEW
jgi:hypothetical protein